MLGFFRDIRDIGSTLRDDWRTFTCLRWYGIFIVLICLPGTVMAIMLYEWTLPWLEKMGASAFMAVFIIRYNPPIVEFMENLLRRWWPRKPVVEIDRYLEILISLRCSHPRKPTVRSNAPQGIPDVRPLPAPQVDPYSEFLRTHAPYASPRKR